MITICGQDIIQWRNKFVRWTNYKIETMIDTEIMYIQHFCTNIFHYLSADIQTTSDLISIIS